jgi:hypothetical protein
MIADTSSRVHAGKGKDRNIKNGITENIYMRPVATSKEDTMSGAELQLVGIVWA